MAVLILIEGWSYQGRFIKTFADKFASKLVMFKLTRYRHFRIRMNKGLAIVRETSKHATLSRIKDFDTQKLHPFTTKSSPIKP